VEEHVLRLEEVKLVVVDLLLEQLLQKLVPVARHKLRRELDDVEVLCRDRRRLGEKLELWRRHQRLLLRHPLLALRRLLRLLCPYISLLRNPICAVVCGCAQLCASVSE
jgi:hypothetical protein